MLKNLLGDVSCVWVGSSAIKIMANGVPCNNRSYMWHTTQAYSMKDYILGGFQLMLMKNLK